MASRQDQPLPCPDRRRGTMIPDLVFVLPIRRHEEGTAAARTHGVGSLREIR